MEFYVQRYYGGQLGRWTNDNGSGESVEFSSEMYKMLTSGDVCIYDKKTKIGKKDCHTYFLLGKDTDTFLGTPPVKRYRFGGSVYADNTYPKGWENTFYLQANELPEDSSTLYDFTGLAGASATDFKKGASLTRDPVDGYMSFGIIKPEGGKVTSPGRWYERNGSWTFSNFDLSEMNFNGGSFDTSGMNMYFDENDSYSPGNIFNSAIYSIIVKSGFSLAQIMDMIRSNTILDNYLAEFVVGNGTYPNKLARLSGQSVNNATYETTTGTIFSYAGIPGLTYKGGDTAYDGGWIFYNIYVTQSLEYAQNYIDNGTVPPDAYLNTIDTDGSKNIDPKFSTPKDKQDNDDPTDPDDSDNSKRDDQTIKLPKENGVSSPSSNWYQMSNNQLKQFIKYFWNDIGTDVTDWFNDIQGLYNNLSEAVIGVKYFPCTSTWLYDVDTEQSPTITVGRYVTTFHATQIKSNSKLTRIGSYPIRERYNNFLDYTATRIELFLPYLGWVELPTQKVMGTKIIVYFGCDMATCQGMYVIKSNGMIVFQSTFNFGIEIPITLSSSVEQVKSAIDTGVSLASSVLSVAMASTVSPVAGGMLAVSTAQNLIPQGYDSIHLIGNATGNSGQLGGKRCAICITRSIPKQPGLYGSRIGFVFNKKKQLSDLSGLSVIENPLLTSTGYASEKEIEEIYALMRKGIIL